MLFQHPCDIVTHRSGQRNLAMEFELLHSDRKQKVGAAAGQFMRNSLDLPKYDRKYVNPVSFDFLFFAVRFYILNELVHEHGTADQKV